MGQTQPCCYWGNCLLMLNLKSYFHSGCQFEPPGLTGYQRNSSRCQQVSTLCLLFTTSCKQKEAELSSCWCRCFLGASILFKKKIKKRGSHQFFLRCHQNLPGVVIPNLAEVAATPTSRFEECLFFQKSWFQAHQSGRMLRLDSQSVTFLHQLQVSNFSSSKWLRLNCKTICWMLN